MATRKRQKRKLTPIGKFLVFILIAILVALIFGKCFKKDTTNNLSNTKPAISKDVLDSFKPTKKVTYAKENENTETLDIESEYGILINLDTNTVIATKNGDKKIYPASMTKIMTLIVAVENAKSLDDTYTFTTEVIDPFVIEDASRAGFENGETVTIKDMLYGCVLPSGADATYGLAVSIAGSEREFVKLMNKKANEMGLKNTHFVNVSGLHDELHYSTAHEIALILNYAMKNPTCAEVLSTVEYTTAKTPVHPEGIPLTSTMFSRMYGTEAEDVTIIAGKTGYTTEGGNCLASYAENADGEKYVLVTGKAQGLWKSIYDALGTYAEYCGNGVLNLPDESSYN